MLENIGNAIILHAIYRLWQNLGGRIQLRSWRVRRDAVAMVTSVAYA